uniref:Leucine rich repeats and calponin homology domain containing 3 n=1 Tax=Rousettus aegyptiacus TaxID=9407 RepID=A0A7J8HSK2_ROUAE|nr:leucine rich repeats and calponin homology domain containing 3 [Rousettus aegyptiacus]
MAYIEQRRITHEGSPIKPVPMREFQKAEDVRRYSHQNRVPVEPSSVLSLSPSHNQLSHTDLELHRRREQLERTRREAQLAALQYEEEKVRTKQIQRDAVLDFVKQKAPHSTQKQPPLDGECPFPSRRSQHTDDSALLVVRALHKMILNNCVQILEISWCAFRNDLYTIKHDGHRY